MKVWLRMAAVGAMVVALPGCIARTALNVVTMPVKATAQVADWATTSQDEADRKRGREIRREEERRGRDARRDDDD